MNKLSDSIENFAFNLNKLKDGHRRFTRRTKKLGSTR